MFIALMSEVSALRDRLDTHEALAAGGQVASAEAVEAFELTEDRQSAREIVRQAMIRRVFRAITEEREATLDAAEVELADVTQAR